MHPLASRIGPLAFLRASGFDILRPPPPCWPGRCPCFAGRPGRFSPPGECALDKIHAQLDNHDMENPVPILNPRTGLVEYYDVHSGEVVRVQRDRVHLLEESQIVKVNIHGREVWVDKSVNLDNLELGHWAYSHTLASIICQKIAEGGFITKICRDPNFPPYSVICMWKKQKPEFAAMMAEARRDRAEFMHDEALDIADKVAPERDEIAKAKLQTELRQWSAEKGAPKEYGTPKNEGGGGGSVTLILATGITRPGDPGFIEVTPHGKNIESVQSVPALPGADHEGNPGVGAGAERDGGVAVPAHKSHASSTPGQHL